MSPKGQMKPTMESQNKKAHNHTITLQCTANDQIPLIKMAISKDSSGHDKEFLFNTGKQKSGKEGSEGGNRTINLVGKEEQLSNKATFRKQ